MAEPSRQLMLKLESVSLAFKAGRASYAQGVHKVLDGLDLELYRGETLGIIGRNGVGKTSMLRVMAGILAPTSGQVYRHPGATASLLTLGLGFKNELSGRDNALLAAMLQGASHEEALSYLDEIQDFSELGPAFDEPVRTYSAGMRSRLGFTTALKTRIDILLVDEVLSVGDASFRAKAEQALGGRIAGEQTVIFVSHMEGQIKSLCDRCIWLEDGRVAMEGEPDDVVKAYRSQVAASTNR
jgi:lipopolysaccharide transport system ATP-binding protein